MFLCCCCKYTRCEAAASPSVRARRGRRVVATSTARDSACGASTATTKYWLVRACARPRKPQVAATRQRPLQVQRCAQRSPSGCHESGCDKQQRGAPLPWRSSLSAQILVASVLLIQLRQEAVQQPTRRLDDVQAGSVFPVPAACQPKPRRNTRDDPHSAVQLQRIAVLHVPGQGHLTEVLLRRCETSDVVRSGVLVQPLRKGTRKKPRAGGCVQRQRPSTQLAACAPPCAHR